MAEKLITTTQLKRLLKGITSSSSEPSQAGNAYDYTVNGSDIDDDLTLRTAYTRMIQPPCYTRRVCIHNNTIYLMSNTELYKLNIDKWEKICNLPDTFSQEGVSFLSYNNRLYIMGVTSDNTSVHYVLNGTSWDVASTLPYNYDINSAIVFQNKIHIFGSNGTSSNYKKHYSWNGTNWNNEGDLTFSFLSDNSVVLFNNKLHIINGYRHYEYDGSTWTPLATLSEGIMDNTCVVYDNKIHILGNNNSLVHNYIDIDGSYHTGLTTLPTSIENALVYNGNLLAFGYLNGFDDKLYVYDKDNDVWNYWKYTYYMSDSNDYIEPLVMDEDVFIDNCRAIEYKNKIHMVGSGSTEYYTYGNKLELSPYGMANSNSYYYEYYFLAKYGNTLHLYVKDQHFILANGWEEDYVWGQSYSNSTADVNIQSRSNYNNIEYNGNLYLFTNNSVVKYDGTNYTFYRAPFTAENPNNSTYPYHTSYSYYSPTILNGRLYAICRGDSSYYTDDLGIVYWDENMEVGQDTPTIITKILPFENYNDYSKTYALIAYNDELHLFDIDGNHYVYRNDDWVQLNSLPYPVFVNDDGLHHFGVLTTFKHRLYLIGGFGHTHEMFKYNPITDTWSNKNI